MLLEGVKMNVEYNESKAIKVRPGPKCKKAIEEVPPQPQSPLKLTIKRLSSCREPAFEVVCKKEESAEMDEMIAEGRGDSHTPSPTPSDILRSEVNADPDRSTWEHIAYSLGFLAPESLDPTEDQDGGQGGPPPPTKGKGGRPKGSKSAAKQQLDVAKEDSGVSSNSDPEPSEHPPPGETDPAPPAAPPPVENGVYNSTTTNHSTMEQESSDSGCEREGSEKDFNERQTEDPSSTTPSTNPSPVGSLTILAPSALNSSVVNGSLPPEPLDSNSVSETFSNLSNESSEPPLQTPPPVKEGLTVLSPAALGATGEGSVNLLNLNNASNDPLGLLRGYMEPVPGGYMMETCEVCGERSENLEQHRAAMGHYKCHVSPDCAVVMFTSASELTNHQHIAHGMLPPPPVPPPPQPSLQQLHQQVQRLPVPYGMSPGHVVTPPPSVSPGYRPPSSISIMYPPPPQSSSPAHGTPPPPYQPTIQLRPFAMETSPSTIRPDGSPVASPALPAGLGRSISISPSTKPAQKRASPAPAIVETSKRSRAESPDCELVDVQQKMPNLPSGISLTVRGADKSKESSGVANILASRGITVTPTVNKAPAPAPASQPAPRSQPVTTLNLSSAVSIVPANQARGRSARQAPAPAVKLPTVDLTQDTTPVFSRRNRPQRFTCQVCDKVFTSQETLNQHLTTHRSPGKLPYKCNLCNAQYPTQQAMLQHKQNYHKEAQGQEMALPVVDMKHPGTIQKLSSLGIRHCVVLSQLSAPGGGMFGLPIIPLDTARNPAVCNLGALGASNVLSLGPAKALR